MNTTNETTYFNAHVQVRGIAPRCRKSDFHIIKLHKDLPLDISEEALIILKGEAMAALAKYKNLTMAELKLTFTTCDGGFESIQLFDSKHKQFNLLGGV